MTDELSRTPLPASVSEYMREYPGATPATIIGELEVETLYRAQVEHYCAVTRYPLYATENACEYGADLRLQMVTWADVAD